MKAPAKKFYEEFKDIQENYDNLFAERYKDKKWGPYAKTMEEEIDHAKLLIEEWNEAIQRLQNKADAWLDTLSQIKEKFTAFEKQKEENTVPSIEFIIF